MPPPSHPHYLTENALYLLWLKDATLADNVVMEVCLHENTKCAQLMLRVILKRDDLVVRSVTAQKTLPNLYGHAVRLDILASDTTGRLYDIEIQVSGALAELLLRSRAYSALLDMHQLRPGKDYRDLRDHWVIFIVDRDIFGLGLPLYRVERCVLGEGEGVGEVFRLFGDGAHIVFVNGARRNDDTPLSHLLHDIFCPDPTKMHYSELCEALKAHKTVDGGSEEMRTAYSKWEQAVAALYQARGREEGMERGIALGKEQGIALGKEQGIAIGEERGIARGREEGKRLLVRVLLKGGYTLEQVARQAELPLEEVRALAETKEPDTPEPGEQA